MSDHSAERQRIAEEQNIFIDKLQRFLVALLVSCLFAAWYGSFYAIFIGLMALGIGEATPKELGGGDTEDTLGQRQHNCQPKSQRFVEHTSMFDGLQ